MKDTYPCQPIEGERDIWRSPIEGDGKMKRPCGKAAVGLSRSP